MTKKPKPLTFEEKVGREVEIFQDQAFARFKIARRIYEAQGADTKEALDLMVERIVSMSRGIITVKVRKQKVATSISSDAIRHNALYLATEILKDLAIYDIRVATYRFPEGICAECKRDLKPKKKARKNG